MQSKRRILSSILRLALASCLGAAVFCPSFASAAEEYRTSFGDGTLKTQIMSWAKMAGVTVEWRASVDYPITHRALALPPQDNFFDALRVLAQVYKKVAVPITMEVENGKLVVKDSGGAKGEKGAVDVKTDEPSKLANAASGTVAAKPASGAKLAEQAASSNSTASTLAKPAQAEAASSVSDAKPSNPMAYAVIRKGERIDLALESWAKQASPSWTLIWYPAVSWKVPADVDMSYHPDVVSAVSEVISILRDEGKQVQLRVSEGNRIMEVLSTEVKHD
jgi:hypothetical protein